MYAVLQAGAAPSEQAFGSRARTRHAATTCSAACIQSGSSATIQALVAGSALRTYSANVSGELCFLDMVSALRGNKRSCRISLHWIIDVASSRFFDVGVTVPATDRPSPSAASSARCSVIRAERTRSYGHSVSVRVWGAARRVHDDDACRSVPAACDEARMLPRLVSRPRPGRYTYCTRSIRSNSVRRRSWR